MVKKIKNLCESSHAPLQVFSVKEKAMWRSFFSAQDTVFSVQGCDLETAFTNFCWQLRKI